MTLALPNRLILELLEKLTHFYGAGKFFSRQQLILSIFSNILFRFMGIQNLSFELTSLIDFIYTI
jgi:hypothetical protein